jgi:hypothetical protein
MHLFYITESHNEQVFANNYSLNIHVHAFHLPNINQNGLHTS